MNAICECVSRPQPFLVAGKARLWLWLVGVLSPKAMANIQRSRVTLQILRMLRAVLGQSGPMSQARVQESGFLGIAIVFMLQ